MYHRNVLVTVCLGLAWLVAAAPAPAPLNINLGAYSPALVVGDGAISFGGEEAGTVGGAAGGAGEAVLARVQTPAVEGPTSGAEAVSIPEQQTVAVTQVNNGWS